MNPPSLRMWIASAALVTTIATGRTARSAEPSASNDGKPQEPESSAPVDVKLVEPPQPHRTLTIEWNPIALVISRFTASIVVVPGDHHALVISPYYTWVTTVPYATQIDSQGNSLGSDNQPVTLNVLSQSFHGYGAELGYRYYPGKGGPRGVFAGPSFIISSITGKAGNGAETPFLDLGGAIDIGYEALVANTVAITLGGGLQYTFPSKSIPTQQWPASIYANDGVRPRVLVSIGYAL